MPDPDPEVVILAAIERHSRGDPAALARMILSELWAAGYDVTIRSDAHDAGPPHYSEADEQRAVAEQLADRPRELFDRLASEPRNAPLADKIREIARKFDTAT